MPKIFMKIILKIISKIVAGYLNCSYLWCKQKGKNIMKTLILILLLSLAFSASKAQTIMSHSEIATKVSSLDIKGFAQAGWKYKIVFNSKKQLIYVFTKTVK